MFMIRIYSNRALYNCWKIHINQLSFVFFYRENIKILYLNRLEYENNTKIPHKKSYENQKNVKKVYFYVKKFKKVVDICFELV